MNSLNPPVIKHNVKGFPKADDILAWNGPIQHPRSNLGRLMDFEKKLKAWKEDPATKSTYVSQKGTTVAKALKEFRDLYTVKEYFAKFGKYDDSFVVFYREK